MSGRVVLVGAGPGDPDLLTVRALRELQQAEVLLYDALIAPAILELASPNARRVDVGKRGDGTKGIAQEAIAERLVAEAQAGHYVVRLKGGDPFVFGRGGEEASALAEAGIPFEIVPGLSSALAVPAYAGIPVTDRRLSASVAIVTGHRGKSERDDRTDWEGLAASAETLIVLMGTAWLEDIVERVIRGGRRPDTPAAVIQTGTRPEQRVVTAPLRDLPQAVREAGLEPPTILLIGEVVALRDSLHWYERRPLFGRRVLVLRSAEQRGPLLVELARRGAQGRPVALLEFLPADRPDLLQSGLDEAGDYDWLVFTSANAVRFAAAGLRRGGPRRLPRVACIGASSAAAAREAGLSVDAVPEPPFTPERLVGAMAARGSLAKQRVLLPRSAESRDTLPQLLEGEGASVDTIDAYRNVLPQAAPGALRAEIAAGVDAVLLTSPSTVERLHGLLGDEGLRELGKSAALACVGPTTAEALRGAGLEPALVAEEQSDRGLVRALAAYYADNGEKSDAVS
ncbi:MAG: uroporphyrinogen-III C-methyltransferase [Deltaproteobacteria bacterium]|nr:uroporphyrinogen-III C-methyltransferase [Deltaproteobacteria bacterium]MBW2415283.1 uroporphyrinogen-III C-methyltransferase [Deltaproteobacteria bacterium]